MKKILYHKYHLFPDVIPVNLYRRLTGMKLVAPFYHAVSDHPLPHLDCLYRVRTSREFEADLEMLLIDFQPVDLQTLIKAVREKVPFQKPVFFLSFDDGLREFHDNAVPVLLRKGVPATCFLNSAFIDNKDMFYRYKVCLIMNEISKKSRELVPLVNRWLTAKKLQPSSYRRFLMKIDYSQRHLADELANLLNLSFENYLHEQSPYLTAGQIAALIKKGFTFGSHSIDHPGFTGIPEKEQVRQTVESTYEITGKFNLPYRVFSFPFTDFGIQRDFFEKINAAAHFDLTFGCAGMKKESYHNHLHRIPVEEYDLNIRKRIKRDYFYYILKSFVSKNKVKRNR
ncbi:MAG TPA: polysaccharide deacetylase family protein [Bacteroidales bacterium]|nr:polysaccharide deacetylase family protein [Bacteroidales bacterium]